MCENKDKAKECLWYLIDIDKLFEYDENVIISLLNEGEILYADVVFKKAAEYGYVQVVERLLKDNRVNPAVDNNYAIRYAAKNGHAKVVEMLLKDKRVNPVVDDNFALIWAVRNGHIKVVELLLKDNRVDPSAEKNYAIRSAAERGYIQVVKMLVEAIEKSK